MILQIGVSHDVNVADLLVATHLAGRVIGFVRRLAVGSQVDHVHAAPPFMGHAQLIPATCTHALNLSDFFI